jgi:hypothetical protein
MSSGIRPATWLAAAIAIAAAVGILRLAAHQVGDDPERQPTPAVSSDRSEAAPIVAATYLHPTAARLPSSPQSVPGGAASGAPSPPQIGLGQRPRSPDSRLASELRIVEEEAARRAESFGVTSAAASPASGSGTASSTADDEARRIQAADAVLIEYLMQNDYRGTEFPTGYPAEQVTRQAAESLVTGLSPEMRLGMLQVALQVLGPDRIGPRFDPYQIWEGAILPR